MGPKIAGAPKVLISILPRALRRNFDRNGKMDTDFDGKSQRHVAMRRTRN